MNNNVQDFINLIFPYIKQYGRKNGILVYSPIIAQGILESNAGQSELGKCANNYFGLKYRTGRVPSACGVYIKSGSEQLANGSYVSSVMQWCKFNDAESCVKGYFEFLTNANGRYNNLIGVKDPKEYLEKIKNDGYCTSLDYVKNCMNVIERYNLTQYDTKEDTMVFTNSQLVDYTRISPNKSVNRSHVIDTITIHCFVGQVTVERGCEVFAPSTRHASCNYVVALDGKIGLVVEEKDRSWCSSNAENDNRAITIEVASDTIAPYKVTDAALKSLIRLCADICKRNNIKELKWQGDKKLIGQVDKQNMTVHRWFANKSCPGDYLYNKHGYIAAEVNKILTSDKVVDDSKISVLQFVPFSGNGPQWNDIIRNLKLAINTDFGTKMNTADANITDDLCIHLGNILLSRNVPVHNVIYVLQQILVWWGFKDELTGNYDEMTENIIGLFQTLLGMPMTKTTTKDTWMRLLGRV